MAEYIPRLQKHYKEVVVKEPIAFKPTIIVQSPVVFREVENAMSCPHIPEPL